VPDQETPEEWLLSFLEIEEDLTEFGKRELEPARKALAMVRDYADLKRSYDQMHERLDKSIELGMAERDAIVRLVGERDAARLERDRMRHERDYVAGYQADLARIDKVLDELDAPHDCEDGVSLAPRRIRLMAERLDGYSAMCAEVERERDEAREKIAILTAVADAARNYVDCVGSAKEGDSYVDLFGALLALDAKDAKG
jgi:predicted nuclease with TOPRIM domain